MNKVFPGDEEVGVGRMEGDPGKEPLLDGFSEGLSWRSPTIWLALVRAAGETS